MTYAIGEAAALTGISVSALRYYDREGMFPGMRRTAGGSRIFSEQELSTLRVIHCLKSAGMSVKEIREFLLWCQEGDASLEKRGEMFHTRLREVEAQMEALRQTLGHIRYKCWYYDTAIAAGTEEAVKNLPEEEIPEELREYKL